MSDPLSSQALGPVSPSLLTRLACPLRVAFEQAGVGGSAGPSEAAALGTVAHRAIELALEGDELGEAWARGCAEEQARSGSDPMDYAPARRTLLRLKKHLPRLLELLSTMPDSRRLSETWLETADVALGGKPDLIAVSPDNLAMVIDYKSGLVSDEEGVKSAYVRQLLFYGALVDECLVATPVMLALLSLREGVVQVEPSVEGMAEVATLARAARLEFNERVPGPQPGEPSEENCQWCRFAARCSAFWQAVEPHWTDAVGDSVRGTVEADPEHATTGVTTLQVRVEHGPLAGSMAILAGIPTPLVASAGVGSVVSVLDLQARSEDPLVLTWTNRATSLARIVVS
jgi:hypothetical protein